MLFAGQGCATFSSLVALTRPDSLNLVVFHRFKAVWETKESALDHASVRFACFQSLASLAESLFKDQVNIIVQLPGTSFRTRAHAWPARC